MSTCILKALAHLVEKKKGQYPENIEAYCNKQYQWDRPTTMENIESAKVDELITESTNKGKISYKISEKGRAMLSEDAIEASNVVSDDEKGTESEGNAMNIDFLDFKKYMFDEMSSVKALVANLSNPGAENKSTLPSKDYESFFIKSLQDRIISLERQLILKQQIIDKLLDQKLVTEGSKENVPEGPSDNSASTVTNNAALYENKSPIVYEDTAADTDKQNSKKSGGKKKKRSKQQHQAILENSTTNTAKGDSQPTESLEKDVSSADNKVNKDTTNQVIVLGDSMVKNIQGWRMKKAMKNDERVFVRSFPGASTDDMSFHAVPSIKKKPSVFVLHTGANDFREEKNDDEIAKKIFNLAKTLKTDENSVYISGIVKRDDDRTNERISNVNKSLKGLCEEAGFPFIDNNNIEVRQHLNRSGLHLNRFGDSKLAFNIISALRH